MELWYYLRIIIIVFYTLKVQGFLDIHTTVPKKIYIHYYSELTFMCHKIRTLMIKYLQLHKYRNTYTFMKSTM